MKYFAGVLSVGMCVVLCSCATPPKTLVRTIVDVPVEPSHTQVVVVSDTARQFGKTFSQSFNDTLGMLAQKSERDVSAMEYIEFVRSPYNRPESKSSYAQTVFVFLSEHSSKSSDYGVYCVNYLLEIKYLDQESFVRQEITVGVADPIFSSKSDAGAELAETVVCELEKRHLL